MGNEKSTYCIITLEDLKMSAGIHYDENIICVTCGRLAKQHRPQPIGSDTLINVPWKAK